MKRPTRMHTRRRHTTPASQAMLNRRMREVWIDGYGILPNHGDESELRKLRTALRSVVDDDVYWKKMADLCACKRRVTDLMAEMKK